MPHITHRIVLHLDMDSFFASCEQRQNPALFGKPVAVCIFSGRDSDSGAISTANYAARALGIKSGMPIKMAKKIAPQATYLPANFALYTGVSDSILEIVKVHCKTTQQASIDEVYADITFEASGDYRIAKALAQTIKKEVFEQEKLTCSIGIAPNKLVAKIASDFQKPDGLTVVKPDEVPGFLSPLPVKKLLGVGPKTESELAKLGIESIADLRKREMSELVGLLGVARGKWLYESSRGTDAQPVQQREMPEQISRIATMKSDTSDWGEVAGFCSRLAQDVVQSARDEGLQYRTASVIFILANLKTHTKSRSFETANCDLTRLQSVINELSKSFFEENLTVVCRRAGVRISGLEKAEKGKGQKSLMEF